MATFDSFGIDIESDDPMTASLHIDANGYIFAESYCDRCGSAHDGVSIHIDELVKLYATWKEANKHQFD